MMDLSHRRDVPEVMDDPGLDAAVYRRCLTDLAAVNRWTFTHRPTLRWLARSTRTLPLGADISVLDVACGDGDLLRAIHRWAVRAGFQPHLAGLDLNPGSAIVAAAATPQDMKIDWRTGNVFAHAPNPLPDYVVTSQFAHHLTDEQVVDLLRWLERQAGRGWFIADLHRHLVPYYGFRLLAFVIRWHRIVRTDGTASVARSFRITEWRSLLERAGIRGVRVRWVMPFRICVARTK